MSRKSDIIVTAVITAAVVFAVTTLGYFYLFPAGGKLEKAQAVIEENYINPLSDEQKIQMEDAAIGAMVQSLGDPYSAYMNREVYDDYKQDQQDTYVGLGVSVVFDYETEELTVVAPYNGSPAQAAGMLPQDVIIDVDGIATSAETYADILDHLKGEGAEVGEPVQVTVRRPGVEEPVVLNMERGEIQMETISTKMLEDDIGYIKLSEFRASTLEDFLEGLEDVLEQGAQGLVIDLRSNPGGYAHIVLGITDVFVPKGELIAYSQKHDGSRIDYRAQEDALDIPMVVLVNEGTASASELFAGSVQALGIGKLVGVKTFGKAVGQASYDLHDGTNIYLTDSRYYTPKGECIDGVGLTPDVEVDLSDEKKKNLQFLTLEEDDQLQAGLRVLREDMQ